MINTEQVTLGSLMDPAGSIRKACKRRRKGRLRRVTVRFTDDEYAELVAGATAAGWTVAGWTAVSGLAAARLVLEGPWTAPT